MVAYNPKFVISLFQIWQSKIIKRPKLSTSLLLTDILSHKSCNDLGSGCGSVGKVVASDSRGPQFKSSHRENLNGTFTVNCIEKTGMANFLKKNL